MTATLILASTSPYRRQLLTRLGLPFEVVSPQVAETYLPGEAPQVRARRLAVAKAQAVTARLPLALAQTLVIGSDQVAALEDRILDKPGDLEGCVTQLRALSGNTAQFFTACALGDQVHVEPTLVEFRTLDEAEIQRYVAREQPVDCAGGFKVEALGISLFTRVTSNDPTALIGLPMIWLSQALREQGLRVP
jgi:septum formation protein